MTDSPLALEELHRASTTRDATAIANAAMSNIWPLYNDHFEELRRAVEALPGRILDRYPVLRLLHRMTPMQARTAHPFKPLIHPDEARSMSPDELDIVTLVQMIAFRVSGDVAAAVVYARRLEHRIRTVQVESRERVDGPLWFSFHQIGSTLLAAGDTAGALLQFTHARDLCRLAQHRQGERMALGRSALAHAVRGSLDDAQHTIQETLSMPPPSPAHLQSTMNTEQTTCALIAVELMAPDAGALLARLEPNESVQLSWPFALLARTRYLNAHRRADETLEAVGLAADTHPSLHGSFASDVINAASIEALWTVGETDAAGRLAESTSRSGQLTRLAIVRHALHESQLDVAERALRHLSSERSAGPGFRAERTFLAAWLESSRSGAVSIETAHHLARLAAQPGLRRLLSTLPMQLLEQVREQLSAPLSEQLDDAVSGLPSVDHPRRPVLTMSELRVLQALAGHSTTSQIAAHLSVSRNTIKTQLSSVYRKLGCSNREDAIRIAVRFRLAPQESGT